MHLRGRRHAIRGGWETAAAQACSTPFCCWRLRLHLRLQKRPTGCRRCWLLRCIRWPYCLHGCRSCRCRLRLLLLLLLLLGSRHRRTSSLRGLQRGRSFSRLAPLLGGRLRLYDIKQLLWQGETHMGANTQYPGWHALASTLQVAPA